MSLQHIAPPSVSSSIFFLLTRPPPRSTLFPYTTLFRSSITISAPCTFRCETRRTRCSGFHVREPVGGARGECRCPLVPDRKSTRLNSSHLGISYAVFCLKKKTETDLAERSELGAFRKDT